MLDSTRLSQVLINLVTNGLKFSGSDGKSKSVSIVLGASKEKPDYSSHLITSTYDAMGEEAPQDFGENPTFLTFKVYNSGLGISSAEAKLLFQRFQQANPKTHITYGGWDKYCVFHKIAFTNIY